MKMAMNDRSYITRAQTQTQVCKLVRLCRMERFESLEILQIIEERVSLSNVM